MTSTCHLNHGFVKHVNSLRHNLFNSTLSNGGGGGVVTCNSLPCKRLDLS